MPRIPRIPTGSRKGRKRNFPPRAAINIIRFARSLWPKPEQDAELCDAIIEATFETVGKVQDDDLRRVKLRAILDRAYEALKEPE
ncbi:hypothetical protein [Novosphingobium sp. KN65.2]|uniref:hypothetical protein n=1 Tax=Novosphingobium sp. KN65.2 TaxID=1478134 RepID=UPI0006D58FE4|nr:hypothetical protein [Novosphingobium sp. KN65.2]